MMTFLEWCLQDEDDENLIDVRTTCGRHYKPGEVVTPFTVARLKAGKLVKEPELKNNIWYVLLELPKA